MNGCAPGRATERELCVRPGRDEKRTRWAAGSQSVGGGGGAPVGRRSRGAQPGGAVCREPHTASRRGLQLPGRPMAEQHQVTGSPCPSRRWPAAAIFDAFQQQRSASLEHRSAEIPSAVCAHVRVPRSRHRSSTVGRLSRLTTQPTTRLLDLVQLDRACHMSLYSNRTPPDPDQHLSAIRATTIVTYAKNCTMVHLHARTPHNLGVGTSTTVTSRGASAPCVEEVVVVGSSTWGSCAPQHALRADRIQRPKNAAAMALLRPKLATPPLALFTSPSPSNGATRYLRPWHQNTASTSNAEPMNLSPSRLPPNRRVP
eukprot:COSAG01_NODE_17447_length_1151_cov_0.998099_1_plen_314_part_00